MILIRGNICYSPEPPENYTRILAGTQVGFAKYYIGDIQRWNLAWLCDPGFDKYLDKTMDAETFITLTESLDTLRLGRVDRALNNNDEVQAFGLPTLRGLLTLNPQRFIADLVRRNLDELALFANDEGGIWERIQERVNLSEPAPPKLEVVKPVVEGNVVKVKFGRTA